MKDRFVVIGGDPRSLSYLLCDDGEWREPQDDIAGMIESKDFKEIYGVLRDDEYIVIDIYNNVVIARKPCVDKIKDFLLFASEVIGLDI